MKSKKVLFAVIAVTSIFMFFGTVHVVSGSNYYRSAIVQKLSFGFSETFINADQIIALPYIAAKFQYPLSILALQRAGYLETDQERETRVEAESKATTARIQAENNATIARIQAESEKAIRKRQGDMHAVLEGLAVLIKAAEEPKTVTIVDGKSIRVDGASLNVVKKNVGNHPAHILWVDLFAAQLKAALGKDYLDVESGLSGPSSTMITGQGDYYFGEACMAHACPDKEAAIAIHTITGEVVVGIRIENKIKVLGAVDASHSPPPIQTWIEAARQR